MTFPSDLDIARQARLRPLTEIADGAGIPLELLEPYGSGAAKIDLAAIDTMADRPRAKYVVVSAITPTPLGEGKTTVAVGLSQGFSHIDKQATLAIRQPRGLLRHWAAYPCFTSAIAVAAAPLLSACGFELGGPSPSARSITASREPTVPNEQPEAASTVSIRPVLDPADCGDESSSGDSGARDFLRPRPAHTLRRPEPREQ